MLDIRDPKFLIVTALTLLVVFIVMALAQRKQRNIWLWGAATLASVFLALIALAFFGYLNRMDAEAQRRSRRRELITCSILILLGVGRFARLLMHAF